MKYKLQKASTISNNSVEEIDILTIGDLINLYQQCGEAIIIDFRNNRIVIYDSYIE